MKLTDADAYRLRIGAYRIVYAVKDGQLLVLIIRVAHRRDIYRQIETIRKRLKE